MSITSRQADSSATPTDEVPDVIPHEINLGVHQLVLNNDQSIELVRSEQGQSEPEYVLCLDATETYRLLQCLCELFKQTTNG